jgi:hypothetical protein
VKAVAVFAATVELTFESDRPDPVTVAEKAPVVPLVTVTVADTVEPSRDALSETGFGVTVRPLAVPPLTVKVTLM